MLCTLVATGLAHHRANLAHIFGERTCPRHEASGKAAQGGAVHVERNALGHRLHILFLQASRGAMIASVCAFVASVDTGLVQFMSHKSLLWRASVLAKYEGRASHAGRGFCCSQTRNACTGCLCDGGELPVPNDFGGRRCLGKFMVVKMPSGTSRSVGIRQLGQSLRKIARTLKWLRAKSLSQQGRPAQQAAESASRSTMLWLLAVAHLDVGANPSSGSASKRDLTVRCRAHGLTRTSNPVVRSHVHQGVASLKRPALSTRLIICAAAWTVSG